MTAFGLSAKKTAKNSVLDLKTSLTDSSIVFPESFESDSHRMLEGWYMRNYTSLDPDAPDKGNPDVSDDMMRRRLSALPTVVELPFNQVVRSYIDRYLEKSRPQVSGILGLSYYYMPIFEQELEKRGLPNELKYLPVIESGLDPNAVSKHGAAGLWQFMLATGKGLGLEVNSLVDERRDPYASSAAAAEYLKSLHDTYNDWSLAIAAYNCGPNNVNKAIRRVGGDPKQQDFWSIYEALTPETRGYVPMFIAANYVFNYYQEHGISPVLPTKPLVTDTLHIPYRVHFNQISEVLDIPVEELRLLNPQYRADVIPGTPDRSYTLILPSRQVQAYLMSRDDILAYEAEKYARRDQVEPGDAATPYEEPTIVTSQQIPSALPLAEAVADQAPAEKAITAAVEAVNSAQPSNMFVHKVEKGETLASIARKYGVSVNDLRNWNHLRRNAVRAGQQLKIQGTQRQTASAKTPSETASSKASSKKSQAKEKTQAKESTRTSTAKQSAPAKKAQPSQHEIKNGETLSSISKKYGVSIQELKAANGMTNDNIRAGKTLKIPAKSSSASSGKSTPAKQGSGKKSSSSKKKKKR